MKVEIVEIKENPLLKRKEIKAEIDHEGASTPKIVDVRNKVSAMLNADKELLLVEKIKTGFGISKSIAYLHLYDSRESLKKVERKHIIAKNEGKKEEKE